MTTPLKIRVLKSEMNKALYWYTMKLYEKYQHTILTPANIENMKASLAALQSSMKRCETNSVWEVPVKIVLFLENHSFEVAIENENNILFLDQNY